MTVKSKIISIIGPTASGKTSLAIAIAKKWNGEIISADSRQVYRGMDLGTGKVTKKEMRGIRHHLLDVASPRSTFSVTKYQKLAQRAVQDIQKRNRLPIICGGTGLYIDAVLYDYKLPEVPPNPKLRKQLEQKTADSLFKQLQKLDPRRAQGIDPHNKRRLIRALEIVIQTGQPSPLPSSVLERTSQYQVLKIGLNPPAKVLRDRIRARILKRLRQGMIAEVQRLHDGKTRPVRSNPAKRDVSPAKARTSNGVSWQKLDNFGLEYRFISRYLRGLLTKREMIAQLEIESWHYAKRQLTWFRRDPSIKWLSKPSSANQLVKNFLNHSSIYQ